MRWCQVELIFDREKMWLLFVNKNFEDLVEPNKARNESILHSQMGPWAIKKWLVKCKLNKVKAINDWNGRLNLKEREDVLHCICTAKNLQWSWQMTNPQAKCSHITNTQGPQHKIRFSAFVYYILRFYLYKNHLNTLRNQKFSCSLNIFRSCLFHIKGDKGDQIFFVTQLYWLIKSVTDLTRLDSTSGVSYKKKKNWYNTNEL